MPDLVGDKLGKYEVVERLGRGGMAEVYKAYQPGVERHVAIKVMHRHLCDNHDFVQRFQQEARSIGQLQHPHCGRVIDFDVEAGNYYMVMEYLQGGALDSCLKQCGSLPAPEALRITLQLASALAYAHQQGVIHRDIKPSNILFTDASRSHALLTDFGLARLLNAQHQISMTGALIGTANYMSPEAARGEPCDARSDLYSLGVVLYEMVTGRTPYAADTPYSFLMKQANEPLPPPRTLNPKLPVALETVLLKALAKEPAERYQNGVEFGGALNALALNTVQAPAGLTRGQSAALLAGVTPVARVAATKAAIAEKVTKPQARKARPSLLLAAMGVLTVACITCLGLLRLDNVAQLGAVPPPPSASPVVATTPRASIAVALPTVTPTPRPTLAPRVITPVPAAPTPTPNSAIASLNSVVRANVDGTLTSGVVPASPSPTPVVAPPTAAPPPIPLLPPGPDGRRRRRR